MTHKNKIKELVGGGLNAYHTKALQQIDRIEKKNKEQNHKISILTNELDNDYLTKTEEGSVISLDHSKEGMVYIDSLEGNTMVNYCTDGSKEMTLNGDINLEGTFVTTTEGVDNGKVDVMCEGNTLILDKEGNEVEVGSEGARLVSVGQDDENGHKIEILSNNVNILDRDFYKVNTYHTTTNIPATETTKGYVYSKVIKLKPNTKYTLTHLGGVEVPIGKYYRFGITDYNKKEENVYCMPLSLNNTGTDVAISSKSSKTFTTNDSGLVSVRCYNNSSLKEFLDSVVNKFVLSEGVLVSNSFIEGKSNKKEILLNEPLRGLSNGVKDRFVKISGKWFIERNFNEFTLEGNENFIDALERNNTFRISIDKSDIKRVGLCLSNIVNFNNKIYDNDEIGIYLATTVSRIVISIDKNKLSEKNINGFIQYLQQNPMTLIYQLNTPTYEPLEINPELITYTDTTHISNNSLIPCNMKVQNSGYNAIIKPSTLYTVALDTNKSGTIGMNLGGVKGTTTNNVLTLTTPATLTDDSLRLYGKGLKGSKVRLLEGDKTNWMPSFFEGMKSCFEDKVQEDGSYEIEVLSNNSHPIYNKGRLYTDLISNKVVFNNHNLTINHSHEGSIRTKDKYVLKPNEKIVVRIVEVLNNINNSYSISLKYNGIQNKVFLKDIAPKISENGYFDLIYENTTNQNVISDIEIFTYFGIYTIENICIIPNNINNLDETKSNKIQFSSIEPLRGVGNIKDKFVFKDGKLMIERNCGEVVLNGGENWRCNNASWGNGYSRYAVSFSNNIIDNNFNKTSNALVDRYFVTNQLSSYEKMNVHIVNDNINIVINIINDLKKFKEYINENPIKVVYQLKEPTYEEIPYELQKIILEGYENGTLFIDTNIPPTVGVTYAGETPIVKSVKLNKTEVLSNTQDINDNIIPYLMDMDYRVVCLQLATEELEGGVTMARLFGGTYEMLKRDILSKRLSRQEYGYRIADYFNAGKLTEEQVRELEDLR